MSFRRLVPALTFIAVFAMAMRVSVDTDTWWHLRAGAWMVENRALLDTDPFSHTRFGEPWIYPGWLAQIILFGLHTLLGSEGLNLLTALMVVLAFASLWPVLEAPPLLRAFVLLLGATASGVFWSARPQIFSFALAGITLALLERARAQDRLAGLWALPLIAALWVNLHGGFAVLFILLGAFFGGELLSILSRSVLGRASLKDAYESRRNLILRLGLILAVCVAAIGANPHGYVMLAYPFQTVSIDVLQQYIQEWQSPNFHQLEVQPFLWLLLAVLFAFGLSRQRPAATELLLVGGFAYLALLAGRNIALFALAAVPPLARHAYSALLPVAERFGPSKPLSTPIAARLNLVLFALALLAAGIKSAAPLSPSFNEAAIAEHLPVQAVAYLNDQQLEGPLFNDYSWGGYILWELYPAYKTFVDGRTDLFEDEILEDYLEAWRAGPGWEQVFDKWEIQVAFLPLEAPLVRALESDGWIRTFSDTRAVVLLAPNQGRADEQDG